MDRNDISEEELKAFKKTLEKLLRKRRVSFKITEFPEGTSGNQTTERWWLGESPVTPSDVRAWGVTYSSEGTSVFFTRLKPDGTSDNRIANICFSHETD